MDEKQKCYVCVLELLSLDCDESNSQQKFRPAELNFMQMCVCVCLCVCVLLIPLPLGFEIKDKMYLIFLCFGNDATDFRGVKY